MGGEIVSMTSRREFWNYMKIHPYIILYATATWCGPCKLMKPYIADLFDQMPKNVDLVILDIDRGKNLASYLHIRNVPQVMNFISGEPYDIMTGGDSRQLVNVFNKTLDRMGI